MVLFSSRKFSEINYKDGNEVSKISVENPTGIAFDKEKIVYGS